jgi:DNA polymerase-4
MAPSDLADRIKTVIRYNIGATLTCSIGFAANRHLAKIASDTKKPDGLTIWHPEDVPAHLARLKLEDIPGIGRSMIKRLAAARVADVPGLLAMQPKQMRALWRNVTGERLWYALHGYAIESPETVRNMFGHARVLPPDQRSLEDARSMARLLLVKAARRMRRSSFYASTLYLWIRGFDRGWETWRHSARCRTTLQSLGRWESCGTMWWKSFRQQPGFCASASPWANSRSIPRASPTFFQR